MRVQNEIERLFLDTLTANDAMIRRVCRTYSTPRTSADDLYQEVVAALWMGLKTFRGSARLTTWLYRVAINSCISTLRRSEMRNISYDAIREDISDDTPDFGKDEYDCLEYLVGCLGHIDKAILLMWLDERSYSEIAEVTGLNISVVGTRLSRIRSRLRALWQKEQKINKV